MNVGCSEIESQLVVQESSCVAECEVQPVVLVVRYDAFRIGRRNGCVGLVVLRSCRERKCIDKIETCLEEVFLRVVIHRDLELVSPAFVCVFLVSVDILELRGHVCLAEFRGGREGNVELAFLAFLGGDEDDAVRCG